MSSHATYPSSRPVVLIHWQCSKEGTHDDVDCTRGDDQGPATLLEERVVHPAEEETGCDLDCVNTRRIAMSQPPHTCHCLLVDLLNGVHR